MTSRLLLACALGIALGVHQITPMNIDNGVPQFKRRKTGTKAQIRAARAKKKSRK